LKKPSIKLYDIVAVHWLDAHQSLANSVTVDGALEEPSCELVCVGFVIRMDSVIALAQEYDPGNDDFREVRFIPKVLVKSIVRLSSVTHSRNTNRFSFTAH